MPPGDLDDHSSHDDHTSASASASASAATVRPSSTRWGIRYDAEPVGERDDGGT
jgi:hypothetical protein